MSEQSDELREYAALEKHSVYASAAIRRAADRIEQLEEEVELYEAMKEGVQERIADLENRRDRLGSMVLKLIRAAGTTDRTYWRELEEHACGLVASCCPIENLSVGGGMP